MENWGFAYKSNIIWYKVRKDGGPDRRGVGFYFRNVTEVLLLGVRGKNARTLQPGRSHESKFPCKSANTAASRTSNMP